MTDTLSPEQRSYNMSMIRMRDTKPEILLRKMLWSKGFRYRLHYKIIGKPDITFPSKRIAIFVDGCFWHGCKKHFKVPKTNTIFWKNKIKNNLERDKFVTEDLISKDWKVIRIWEHELLENPEKVLKNLLNFL